MNKKLNTGIAVVCALILGGMIWVGYMQVQAPVFGMSAVPTSPQGKLPAGSPPPMTLEVLGSRTWIWEETLMADGSIVTPTNGGAFTLSFSEDGTMTGTTDCNRIAGEVMLGSDGVIAFGPLMATKMYCEGSDEAEYTAMLARASRQTMDEEGNLYLILSGAPALMRFSSVPGGE